MFIIQSQTLRKLLKDTEDRSNSVYPGSGRLLEWSGIRGWKIWLAFAIIVGSLVVLYYIITSRGAPGVLDLVTKSYSFSSLISTAVSTLGISEMLLIVGAVFALLAFFTAIPSSGGFTSQGVRVAGLFFLQQTIIWPFILILLVDFNSFLSALPYVIVISLGMYWNQKNIKHDLTYEEYEASKSGSWGRTYELSTKRFLSANVLLIAIVLVSFYLMKFNPTMSLIGWFLTLYYLFFGLLQVALSYGYLFQAVGAKKVKISTTGKDEVIEGWLVAKGEDHFLVRTKDESLLLPVSSVAKIVLLEKPQEPGGTPAPNS
jgi:hypothetical protein